MNLTYKIYAVGNFCVYPRKGSACVHFPHIPPHTAVRAAKALKLQTEGIGRAGVTAIGICVGYAEGYSATIKEVNNELILKLISWFQTHPEAFNPPQPPRHMEPGMAIPRILNLWRGSDPKTASHWRRVQMQGKKGFHWWEPTVQIPC